MIGITVSAKTMATVENDFVPEVVDISVAKESKQALLAARRYAAEEGGTTFNGLPLATDRTTQTKITAAYVKAMADPDYVIASWKFAAGVFATLDAQTIIAAANAIEAHVQACFAHEASLSAQIMAAADAEALALVDLDAGWPGPLE